MPTSVVAVGLLGLVPVLVLPVGGEDARHVRAVLRRGTWAR